MGYERFKKLFKRGSKYRKTYRKYRRYYNKRYNKSQGNLIPSTKSQNITRMYGGFPKTLRTVIRYSSEVIIPAIGVTPAASWYAFRANSIYDPDMTGIGHQPMGRDIFDQVYKTYTVLGSKCKVTYSPASSANGAVIVGLRIEDNAAGLPAITASGLMEQGGGKYKVLNTNTLSGYAGFPPTLTAYFSPKKYFGVKDVCDNPDLSADQGGNPSKAAYYLIWQATDLPDTIDAMRVLVSIDYIVEFSEPKDIAQS